MSSETPLPATAEAVLTFLESVGRRSEAELYLRLFRGIEKHSFAVIVAEAPVVRQALGSLLEQLRFLSELGLAAAVAVGLFDPASAESGAEQLAEQLKRIGLQPCTHPSSDPGLAARVREELDRELVPIVSFQPAAGVPLSARLEALSKLVGCLGTRKIVVVRRQGGLGPRGDEPLVLGGSHTVARQGNGISVINLRTDLEPLLSAQVLPARDQALLQQCHDLLSAVPTQTATISVTSPLTLLTELFTVRGAGTLIKTGTEIERHSDYCSLDLARLRSVLESSFARTLSPQFFGRPPLAVFVERGYRGVAILEPSPVAPYLSKFAVEPVAQGEGIGQDLWQAITRQYRSLVWRSRPANPIRSWYANVCHGMLRLADWHVFWRGLEPEQVAGAVVEARSRPNDFYDARCPNP